MVCNANSSRLNGHAAPLAIIGQGTSRRRIYGEKPPEPEAPPPSWGFWLAIAVLWIVAGALIVAVILH